MTLAEAIEAGDLLAVARHYVAAGLSVIPVRADGSKAAAVKWADLMERAPTADELTAWFAPHRAVGVAIVCGKVSGNLAVMDFESDSAWRRWHDRAAALGIADWYAGFPLVRTPKGGRHLYCRIAQQPAPGGKLAMRSKSETLIEVRGQGNYVLAPGCPTCCHELNAPYTFESLGWLNG
ncbi:MAG: bifunctional DNA primase/polymerase [Gemmata sp.]